MSNAIGQTVAGVRRGKLMASARPDLGLRALLASAALTCAILLAPAWVNGRRVTGFSAARPARGLPGHWETRLPIDLAPTASTDIGGFDRAFWPARRGAFWRTAGGGVETTFTSSGALLHVPSGTADFYAVAVGRADRELAWATAVAPQGLANEVRYLYGSLTELYRNGPYGLEQGFTVGARPQAGRGALVIALRVSGSLRPEQVAGEVRFRSASGRTVLRDGALNAEDATGRRLPAVMLLRKGAIELRIDDSGARYPLHVDPFITQAKIPGYGGTSFGGGRGTIALSADGNTALIGAATAAGGESAWVFTRSGSTWSEQARLVAPRMSGSQTQGFGQSVALSADGSTALVGSGYGTEYGAAWVFTRSGSTWTEQAHLEGTGSGESRGAGFGDSVALSADGNTALIGGPHELPQNQEGAAWVFARSEGKWTTQGATMLRGAGEISATGSAYSQAEFGHSVALSGDGQVALVGAWRDSTSRGAAWVFERSGSGWIERGKLTGAGEVGAGQFGDSLALSADGHVALMGGSGAAWIFERAGYSWVQRGSKLTASDDLVANEGHFGKSVALSADGNTALFGGPNDGEYSTGAAWLFRRSGSSFSQAQEFRIPDVTREESFGSDVALSGDGTTALISAPGEFTRLPAGGGAVWVFVGPPWSPTGSGPLSGGSTATGPLLSHVAQSHHRWREHGPATRSSRRASLGTTFSFTLNQPAKVTLLFTQRVSGRRVKGRCVPRSRGNRRERVCARRVNRGSISVAERAGRHRIFFDGRLSHANRLSPGSYTVAITATNAAGRRSAPAQLSFTIVG
jgi:hypothetical protein